MKKTHLSAAITAAIPSLVTLAAWFRKTRTRLCAVAMSLATFTQVFGQPVIIQQPQNQTNVAGTTATFSVGATGTEPLTYQWRSYSNPSIFTNIPFGTEATLVLTNVQPTLRRFAVVVTDAGVPSLSATSRPLATLTVGFLPVITHQPADQIVDPGGTATFTVAATGTAPLAYQWRFNDANLAGKTSTNLVLANVLSTNAGNYAVVVTGAFGSVTSRIAVLTLTVLPPSSVQVVQVHQSKWPAWQGKWPTWPRGDASDVEVVGNYAYVALRAGGLAVFDMSNPTNCVQVGGYDTSGDAQGVAVSGNYAYVADGYAGLEVIDVRNPTNCVRVGGYDTSGYAYGVAVAGNYAYVADSHAGLQVIDVSDPANCVRVGGYDTSGTAYAVAVTGNYAYVADDWDGLQVVDVRDPTNCVRVGGCDTRGRASGVAVSGNYAYLASAIVDEWGTEGGVDVIDVSDPTNCVRVGGDDTIGPAYAVAVSGNYAYLAGGPRWTGSNYVFSLQVIDVRDPTNCVRVGIYDTRGFAQGVAVSGNYAYVTFGKIFDGSGPGLDVIDVSDPTHCVRVGGYVTSGAASAVAVSGNYAYVADGDAGLQVIDVSNPTNCVRVAGYDTSGYALGVAVVAGRIYVADGAAGLLVLPTLRNVQFTVRVDATPGETFTLEAATNLNTPISWTPLVTTNVPAMPFDYVDFDAKLSEKPRKFYRVRQP